MSRNTLKEYRRVQLEVRKEFDAFTSVHCKTCPHPCCVRPSRMTSMDIILAQNCGWKPDIANVENRDLAAEQAAEHAKALTEGVDSIPYETCEYLKDSSCSFPKDLRPFGCTTYICPIMYLRLDKKSLVRMKRSVKELTIAHEELMRQLNRSIKMPVLE